MPNSPFTCQFLQQMNLLSLAQSSSLHQIYFSSHLTPSHPNFCSLGFSLCWFLCLGCSFSSVAVSPLPRSSQVSVIPGTFASSVGPSPALPSSAPVPLASSVVAQFWFSLPLPPHPNLPTPSPSSSPQIGSHRAIGHQPSHQPLPMIKAVWGEPVHRMLGWDDILCLAWTTGFSIQSILVGLGQDRDSSLLLLAP